MINMVSIYVYIHSERTPHVSTLVTSDDDDDDENESNLPINKTYAEKYDEEQRKLAISKSKTTYTHT